MKKFIVIGVIALVIVAIILCIINKEAKKKKERSAFSGYTRDELKRKLQLAWKDKYFEAAQEHIKIADDLAAWRDTLQQDALDNNKTFDQVVYEHVQFGWAKDNPKAWDTAWSRGWLEHVYLKDAGIEATPEVKQLLKEI